MNDAYRRMIPMFGAVFYHATVASGIVQTHLSALQCLEFHCKYVDTHLSNSLSYVVVESMRQDKAPRPTRRESRPEASHGVQMDQGVALGAAAPMISAWIRACFPGGSPTSNAGIDELIAEAAEAARNDFGIEAAKEWANGYVFPREFVDSDVRCLRAAQLDFRSMVARRLKILSRDRLSHTSVKTLSPDNPELGLMSDLVDGMRVAIPGGFVPNGNQPRSPLRCSYEAVSSAVNNGWHSYSHWS